MCRYCLQRHSHVRCWISILLQVIDPAKSSVELLATKVELKLRKADPSSWPSLEVKQTVEPKN